MIAAAFLIGCAFSAVLLPRIHRELNAIHQRERESLRLSGRAR